MNNGTKYREISEEDMGKLKVKHEQSPFNELVVKG